ncbi:MAG: AbrB/MazE/SpoVT family DNA-binding domain-containing protein [Methanobrevibacter sp.]|jgi:AbrB family looped-hinge helix DNA binding protein|nr:AbrB/MazE/SpoVT family DNA-binding domain-containing protein [Candidatus Methanoflexus mossambicus]
MIAKTSIYPKFQTTIPKEIRKKIKISENDIIEWDINKEGIIELKIRKKTGFMDLVGKYDSEPFDSNSLLKKMDMGEDI